MTDGYALEWDSEISAESKEFTLLPDGEYPFTVTALDRERHSGSAKLPPCPKAVVHLEVFGGAAGTTTIKHNLFLHSKTQGLLAAFLKGIGQRQSGETIKPDWSRVIGSAGHALIGSRTFTGSDGQEVTINEVRRFIEPPADTCADGAF